MDLMKRHEKTFKTKKPIIGCLHLMALPGTPYYDPSVSIEDMIVRITKEAKILTELGFDAIVFANEGDRPYLLEVGPEIIAAYVRVVSAVVPMLKVPYGCGVLIDPKASLAVAKAIGASFIRTYVTNAYEGTFGSQEFHPGEIFRYQRQIHAEDVAVYTYFEAHAGVARDNRLLEDQISSGLANLPIAGTIIGGPRAGLPPETARISEAKKAYPNVPILMGSGSNAENVHDFLPHCDGVIVGSTMKRDGYLYNEIEYERAKKYIEAARR